MFGTDPQTSTVPDAIVSLRQFVGGLNAALNDQSFAGTDNGTFNPSGQFVAVGPNGTSVEGQPITLATAGRITVSPVLLLIGGLVAVLLLKKA